MLNLVKADVYRMTHQKSFYVTLALELFFYTLILHADGFTSNTAYATFDHNVNSIVDFLYYLPKSAVFVTGLMSYGAVLISETYSSKCAASIYPVYTKRAVIVCAQWMLYCLIYGITMILLIVMALLSSLWLPNAFGSIQVLDYLVYAIVQGCFYAAMMSMVGVVSHWLRNTTITQIFAIGLGASLGFLVCMGIFMFLHLDGELLQYTIYVSSGTLPYTFTLDGYITPMLVCLGFTLVAQAISTLCLQKKDFS